MNKIYNDSDNKHSNLIRDLKNLSKVNAPENFEFNLMTRIENKNFNLPEEERPRFSLIKFLAPSAVVVTAVLLFFIFYPNGGQLNNTQQNQQPAVSQSVADNVPAANTQTSVKVVPKNETPAVTRRQITVDSFRDQSIRNQARANTQPIPLQRNPYSVSVDKYISGNNNTPTDLSQGNVVSGGDQPMENDGFFFKQKMSQQTLKRYREIVDSLKKAQLRLDSLKKASKIPQ